MDKYKLNEIDFKRILGRNVSNVQNSKKPLSLFWAGSSLEINVKAKEVWVLISCDFNIHESYVVVFINGRQTMRFIPPKKRPQWICIARNLNPNINNLISIMKDTQPMPGDLLHSLTIFQIGLNDGGIFCPLENRNLNIEFVGDSITTGEGLIGNPEEMDWIATWMSVSNNYAVQTANALNADFSIISQCGWGVCWGWDGNRNSNIPKYYNQICGVIGGKKQDRLGALELYDFNQSVKDFIIINLGTNDFNGFLQPAWKDPETGKVYELSLSPDGKLKESDKKEIQNSVISFLNVVRIKNPSSTIIWALGMIKIPVMFNCIKEAVELYKNQNMDKKVFFLELDSMEDVEKLEIQKGSRLHPGPEVHKLASKKICNFINEQIQYERIKNVFNKIIEGKKVTIATLGGSITTGYASNPIEKKSWACLVEKWFNTLGKKYNSEIEFLNCGISGTDSAFGVIRVDNHIIQKNVDLLILEFAMNDQWLGQETRKNTYEGIIRKVLSNSKISIFALFVNEKNYPYKNNQIEQKKICEYYHIPSLSWKDSLFNENLDTNFNQFFDGEEYIHPNNSGHKNIADYLIKEFLKIFNITQNCLKNGNKIDFCEVNLPKPLTQNQFENCKFYHNKNIKPIKNEKWIYDSPVHPEWEKMGDSPRGWMCSSNNCEITFKIFASSVGVTYSESDQFKNSLAWVSLKNGFESPKVELKCFSQQRKGYLGWAYKEIFNSKEEQELIVHICSCEDENTERFTNITGIIAGAKTLVQ